MKKIAFLVCLSILTALASQNAFASTAKAGAPCSKIGATAKANGKLFTCIKSGKKKVWNRGVVLPVKQESRDQFPSTLSPAAESPEIPVPVFIEPAKATSFDNLVENAKGIPYWAWRATQERRNSLGSTSTNFVINVGPNTTLKVKEPLKYLELTSKFFSNRNQAKTVYVTFFDYPDVAWAQELDSRLSARPRSQEVFDSCSSKKLCNGANAYVDPALNGFNYHSSSLDFTREAVQTNGVVVAHEFFHTLQGIQMETAGLKGIKAVWMPDWIREGSAQWFSTALLFEDFEMYMEYRKNDADQELYRTKFTEQQVAEVLSANDGVSSNGWLAYNVGARAVEALVLVKGIDSILELYDEGAKGLPFETAFKNVYGIEWNIAKPILCRAISKQFL